jgi:hypothetical protein
MPPEPMVIGAKAIGDFLAHAIFPIAPMRLVEVHANRSSAFVAYLQQPDRESAFALLVLDVEGNQVTHMDAFVNPRVLARFALPRVPAR